MERRGRRDDTGRRRVPPGPAGLPAPPEPPRRPMLDADEGRRARTSWLPRRRKTGCPWLGEGPVQEIPPPPGGSLPRSRPRLLASIASCAGLASAARHGRFGTCRRRQGSSEETWRKRAFSGWMSIKSQSLSAERPERGGDWTTEFQGLERLQAAGSVSHLGSGSSSGTLQGKCIVLLSAKVNFFVQVHVHSLHG